MDVGRREVDDDKRRRDFQGHVSRYQSVVVQSGPARYVTFLEIINKSNQ